MAEATGTSPNEQLSELYAQQEANAAERQAMSAEHNDAMESFRMGDSAENEDHKQVLALITERDNDVQFETQHRVTASRGLGQLA